MKTVQVLSPLSQLGSYDIPVGITLAEVHARHSSQLPTVIVLNGAPVMRAEWHRIVQDGDEVALAIMPGKGGFKQILGAVALIALAVVAPGIGTAIAGAGIGGTLVSAGIVLAGSLLINALVSPSAKKGTDVNGPGLSPTYSTAAEGNQARLLQPIPRLYGRHILNPDYAAKPYSYFSNNEQYLCQLFSLGVGLYDLEEIRIDKTTIWRNGTFTGSYAAVEIVKYEPGQTVSLFRPEVETSSEVSGQSLDKNFNAPIQATFASNSVFASGGPVPVIDAPEYMANYRPGDIINIDGAGVNNGQYTVIDVDKVNFNAVTVDRVFPFQGVLNNVGITNVNFVGPFLVNPPRTTINKIELDFDFPGGLNRTYFNDDGGQVFYFPTDSILVEYRQVNDIGQSNDNWSQIQFDFAYPFFNDQRATRTINVAEGRYELRMRRLTKRFYGQGWNSTINWVALKGYYIATGIYPDVTTLAIRIRADNQISSQTSRRFSTIQVAKLQQWTGTAWSAPVPTRRISDAFFDALRNPIYGVGLPDDRIDIVGINALEQIWASRSDTFDGVFDSKYTSWDALSSILFVGRAKPLIVGGVVTAVRDQPRTLARAVFTPLNIRQGSLEIEHVMNDENSPTDAIVSFMDERTWTLNEVDCFIDQEDRDNPARIDGFGITQRSQAWREGIYAVASNKYRRIFSTFSTEMEGKLLMPLDKVVINHDLPRYGQSGSLLEMTADALAWLSTEPLVMPTGQAYASLRTRTGGEWGPVMVDSIDYEGQRLRINPASYATVSAAQGSALSFVNIGYENEGDPAAIMFGSSDSYVKPFRVVASTPRDESNVTVVCTNEDLRVHSAETDYTIPDENTPITSVV